jgi:hypothetical protein
VDSLSAGAALLHPDLPPVRCHPRFEPIASRSRAHFVEMLGVVNDARARGEFPKYLEKPLADLLAKLGV